MRIRCCIEPDCYETSTDSTQLCPKHLAAYIKKCEAVTKKQVRGDKK